MSAGYFLLILNKLKNKLQSSEANLILCPLKGKLKCLHRLSKSTPMEKWGVCFWPMEKFDIFLGHVEWKLKISTNCPDSIRANKSAGGANDAFGPGLRPSQDADMNLNGRRHKWPSGAPVTHHVDVWFDGDANYWIFHDDMTFPLQ